MAGICKVCLKRKVFIHVSWVSGMYESWIFDLIEKKILDYNLNVNFYSQTEYSDARFCYICQGHVKKGLVSNFSEWKMFIFPFKRYKSTGLQLLMGLIIISLSNGWVTKWTDGGLVTTCLEQETKSINEHTREALAECICRSFNTGYQICNSCNESYLVIPGWMTSYLHVLVNTSSNDHVKQVFLNGSW
jgi:hypothetical protein